MHSTVLLSLLFISTSLGNFGKVPKYRELNKELLEEGLIRMVSGHPTVKCVVRTPGQLPTVETCQTLDKDNSFHSVGCWAAFVDKGDYLEQGCMTGPEFAMRDQCTKDACDVDPIIHRKLQINFCCCFGDTCNAHDTLPDPVKNCAH